MKAVQDGGGTRSLLAEHLAAAEFAELESLLDDAGRLLGPSALPPLEEIDDFGSASAALQLGWQRIRTAVTNDGAVAQRVDCLTLEELADRIVRNERVVRTADGAARESAMQQVRETLADLRDIDSVDALVAAWAEAVCRLGFDRSIVSRVENNTWLAERVHLEEDADWASAILSAGRNHPVTLVPGLPEDEARRRRRPILVTQVQERSAIHQAIASTSGSRSYVAAPIMPGGRLLGFVHGDRFFHRGDVTEFDAELIGLFTQGYSFALERAMMAEELAGLRHAVRQIGAGLQACADAEGDPPSLPFGAAAARTAGFGVDPAGPNISLTRREHDVFALLAQGETNRRIARRLSISEGTVKSHVKHILRKLGAANRAEAVARWHEARQQG
ncbi:MAG: LuxR C-terminal-related transcriptional regulator [Nocardioidaceae bacterium]|nr:LuxR C-terminal-related transcriptional regulator [Nocardioidaceae bacterium]